MASYVRCAAIVLFIGACPGDPVEGSGSASIGEGSSGSTGSDSLTSSSTLSATGVSATMSSDSDGSTGPTTSPTTTSPTTTSPTTTTDASATDPTTTDATDTDPTTNASDTDPTTTDASATTDATTSESTGNTCAGDEDDHMTSGTATPLDDNACDEGNGSGAAIIDGASSPDWWSFDAIDVSGKGTCEPQVRVEVDAAVPLQVCAYSSCDVACQAPAMADGTMGCCDTDVVRFSVDCGGGNDDSSTITFSVGDGGEDCLPYTFEYDA